MRIQSGPVRDTAGSTRASRLPIRHSMKAMVLTGDGRFGR